MNGLPDGQSGGVLILEGDEGVTLALGQVEVSHGAELLEDGLDLGGLEVGGGGQAGDEESPPLELRVRARGHPYQDSVMTTLTTSLTFDFGFMIMMQQSYVSTT